MVAGISTVRTIVASSRMAAARPNPTLPAEILEPARRVAQAPELATVRQWAANKARMSHGKGRSSDRIAAGTFHALEPGVPLAPLQRPAGKSIGFSSLLLDRSALFLGFRCLLPKPIDLISRRSGGPGLYQVRRRGIRWNRLHRAEWGARWVSALAR